MNVKLGFSPCPNDTYMMYGMINRRIKMQEMNFNVEIMDVEELNLAATKSRFDVTKLSFKTYYDVSDSYELLDVGAALGRGNGPLLISKKPLNGSALSDLRIAVPGLNTTATFLLRFAYPDLQDLRPMLFSDIEDAIDNGMVDAGVIIHETRFMYAERGFSLVDDLGAVWESRTGLHIPLGCFVVKKELSQTFKSGLNDAIRKSIMFADSHYSEVLPYIKTHAQELDDGVIKQHIDMFVNQYSKSLGADGRASIDRLFVELNKIYGNNFLPKYI